MTTFSQYTIKSIVVILLAAMLFSCQDRIKEVRQLDQQNYSPSSEQSNFKLIYTDSGKTKVKLSGQKLLDFSNLDFPYREFPKGAQADIYDDDNDKNTIKADYAISYEESELIDLQGNVEIVMADSTVLIADQLYWDQSRNWVFTDQEYSLKMTNGTVNDGQGFDSNENFDNFISRSNIGVHYVEEKEQ